MKKALLKNSDETGVEQFTAVLSIKY